MNTPEGSIINERLSRIVRMQGSDPAFFVLSVHSFIEAWLRDHYQDHRRTIYLGDLVFRFRLDLRKRTGGPVPAQSVLDDIVHSHDITNAVRHAFKALYPDEARVAAEQLARFCRLANIDGGRELAELAMSARLWDERSSRHDDAQRMLALGYELSRVKKSEEHLEAELTQFREIKVQRDKLDAERSHLNQELESERDARRAKDQKYDEARRRLAALEGEIRTKDGELDALERAKDYAIDLSRLTLYNRTRLEHERELIRLSPDQQRILDEITLGDDFLVKGGAGTGKTLVLLKALEKLFQLGSQQLSLNLPAASYVLITYSNTLVKYDRYVASIIDIAERDERILSADQYLDLKFRQAFPDVFIEVDAVRALLGKAMKASAIDVLTPDDAYAEIEEFMFANDVTEAEYCIQGIDRSGMRRRLDPKERLLVWRLRCLVVELMESEKVFSRNYSRTRLAESARKNTELRTEDLVFVDEVQDLAPCDLLALKALSRKAIIMSGDNDQAIFRKGFSFKRAGIDIVGRSRTINLNFRNTLPINELAERFRERALTVIDAESGATRKAHERPSQAFRPGPPPELHVGNSESELGHLLIDKIRIYIDLLAYEPETITILGPDEPALSRVVQILDEAGIPNCLMDASSFSFSSSKGVRISGMKSAKGIDFSVTVLYLPRLPESLAAYDPGYNEAVIRNTIYVSLTRSMEQLAVIMPQDRPSHILRDLADAFESDGTP